MFGFRIALPHGDDLPCVGREIFVSWDDADHQSYEGDDGRPFYGFRKAQAYGPTVAQGRAVCSR